VSELLATLLDAQGTYRGRGDGPETGPFLARIDVRAVIDGRGVAVDVEATSDQHGLHHGEHTVLTTDENGRLALHVLCTEMPGVVRFTEGKPGVFTSYDGPLQARIVVTTPADDQLVWAWWWTRNDSPLAEQFRAEVTRTG